MGSINCKEQVADYSQSADSSKMSEYTEPVVVCNESDVQENEMKQLDFNDKTKILLIKQNGKLSAIGNKCSHYGAPLHTGALGLGRVRCPWHGACFNLETGDIEDFPGLDSIPCYKVHVDEKGQVQVRAKRKDLENTKRIKDMVKRSEDDNRIFVIIGGGPAGGVCAETLRQEGYTGRIVMICRENNLPYDRVKISKSLDIDISTIQFRDKAFYNEYGIETMLGVEVTNLNAENKTVTCSNGYSIKYEKVFIATGCQAAKPPITGGDLKNVVTLRDHSEANAIHQMIKPEMNVVCLGASFIALESAAYMAKKVKSVTVIGREDVPLKPVFGTNIGERVLKLFQANGVNMIMDSGILAITGNVDGEVSEVELKDGSKLPCDMVIMGTGTRFNTNFLLNSGVTVNSNGSIDADMNLMTNIPNVYVGGDIANAPVYSIGNRKASIGHYQLAQYHGRVAAINMAGGQTNLHAIPFFFTMLFGKGLRYSGYGNFEDVFIEGDLENMKFVAYFLNEEGHVVAVASCGRDPIVSNFAELQAQGKRLHRTDIEGKENPTAWTKMIN